LQPVEPVEERSADVVLPVEATKVVLPVEAAPAENAKDVEAAPDVLVETVTSTETPLAEAIKPADNAPIVAAKPTDTHLDPEPILGTMFSRSAVRYMSVNPSNSYDDRHMSVPPFFKQMISWSTILLIRISLISLIRHLG
jgi:hypothetical protein